MSMFTYNLKVFKRLRISFNEKFLKQYDTSDASRVFTKCDIN